MSRLDRRAFATTGALAAATCLLSGESRGDQTAQSGRPKFRLGLVTYNLAARWDQKTLLRACKATGVGPVELRTTHAHGVEPSLGSSERQEVRSRFKDAGVEIWGLGTVCEFHSPNPDIVKKNIETCKSFVQLAADLGARGVKVRPNGLPAEVPVEKTLEQIGKALVPCGEFGADKGIEIWVEVHGKGTSIPSNIRKIMECCGHKNVGLTWNSNGTDVVNGSVAESFKMLQPWIRSCHINEIYKDLEGKYPYRELFHLFRESGYDRVTMIELGMSVPDATVGTELLRYYKALWTELARG